MYIFAYNKKGVINMVTRHFCFVSLYIHAYTTRKEKISKECKIYNILNIFAIKYKLCANLLYKYSL